MKRFLLPVLAVFLTVGAIVHAENVDLIDSPKPQWAPNGLYLGKGAAGTSTPNATATSSNPLVIFGTSTRTGTDTLNGDQNVNGDAGVGGNELVGGNFEAGAASTFDTSIEVKGFATMDSQLNVKGNLNSVLGDAGFNDNVLIKGATSLANGLCTINTTGDLSCQDAGFAGLINVGGGEIDDGAITRGTHLLSLSQGGTTNASEFRLDLANDSAPNTYQHVIDCIGNSGACTFLGQMITSSTTSPQVSGTGAAAFLVRGATGQTTGIDCGGGTCTAALGATNATTTTVGRAGQTTTLLGTVTTPAGNSGYMPSSTPTQLYSMSAVTFANATVLQGYNPGQPVTLTAIVGKLTTASAGTGSIVVTATDGTNTCTFTGTCAGALPATGYAGTATYRMPGVNGAGTGCVYASGASITASITASNCGTTTPVGSFTLEGKYQ